jgi:large subunit ribosomal protein L31
MVYARPEKPHNFLNDNNFKHITFNKKMVKPNIHPQWYPNAKVYCDGQLIMKVGSTKPRLNVDIWSGNHPFYTGSQKILDTEGRVERFMRKYGIENQT